MEIIKLITRNVDCSTLTSSQFASMMIEDMQKAKEVYDSIWYSHDLEYYNNRIKSIKEATAKHARNYAENKWKTEKKRTEYIAKVIADYKPDEFKYCSISFFDFNVNPGSMGISNDCILSYDNMTNEAMISCFNTIKDNKYFKAAKGWIFEDHHHSRPQIKLILDENIENIYNTECENLTKAVNDFYKGCKYWGD